MSQNIKELVFPNFSTGLNTSDSSNKILDSDLQIADNVDFSETGEVYSLDGLLQTGNKIKVNSVTATLCLGACKFNSSIYAMVSNGTVSRIVKKFTFTGSITAFADGGSGTVTVTSASHGLFNGDSVTITGTTNYNGTFTISSVATNTFKITDIWVSNDATGSWSSLGWKQVSSQDFSATAMCDMQAYNNKLWIVNGLTTNSNVLHFVDTSDNLTGLTTSSGLESGINRISIHLERAWISYANRIYVSIQYPTGTIDDWDASRVYAGSEAPGLIQIDDNPNDEIMRLISYFGDLVVFRKHTIHVVNGQTILSSTIQKSFNSTGTIAAFSVAKADAALYFLGSDAVKQFSGISTKDQATQYDNITSIGMDRKIRAEVTSVASQSNCIGHSFGDRYFLSDKDTKILIFNELTGGWSKFTQSAADFFLEDNGSLFIFRADGFYQYNAGTSVSVSSRIKTKDFNLGTDLFFKCIERAQFTLKRYASESDVRFEWYLDGAQSPTGYLDVTVQGSSVVWDAGYAWDSGIKWDSIGVNFFRDKKRQIGSCVTVAFGVKASGTNRFSLSTIDVLFDQVRKEA